MFGGRWSNGTHTVCFYYAGRIRRGLVKLNRGFMNQPVRLGDSVTLAPITHTRSYKHRAQWVWKERLTRYIKQQLTPEWVPQCHTESFNPFSPPPSPTLLAHWMNTRHGTLRFRLSFYPPLQGSGVGNWWSQPIWLFILNWSMPDSCWSLKLIDYTSYPFPLYKSQNTKNHGPIRSIPPLAPIVTQRAHSSLYLTPLIPQSTGPHRSSTRHHHSKQTDRCLHTSHHT